MDSSPLLFNLTSSIALEENNKIFITYFPDTLVDRIPSLLSLAATVTVLIILWITKFYRHPLHRMVFFLIFADFLFSLVFLINMFYSPKSAAECKMLLSISSFGRNSSLWWSVAFAHALMKIMEDNDFSSMPRLMRYYYLTAVYLPIGITLSFVLTPMVDYNPDIQRCGRYDTVGSFNFVYFLVGGVPLTTCCLLSIYFYMRTGCRLKALFAKGSVATRELLILVLYPAIMLFCWGPSMIQSFVTMITEPDQAYMVIPKICLGLHGFLNSLTYGLSKKTREDLKAQCSRGKKEENWRDTDQSITMSQELSYIGSNL